MADTYDFEIEQGATFTRIVTWTDENGTPMWEDPTGWTAVMKIKTTLGGTILVSLSDGNGIALSTNGVITITIAANITSQLDFETAVYDLKLTNSGASYRVLEGAVTLDREVSN